MPFGEATRTITYGRTHRVHTWADNRGQRYRHTWVYRPINPFVYSREHIEVDIHGVAHEIYTRLVERGAVRNYRSYSSWPSVQMTLEVRTMRHPTDTSWAEPFVLPCPILNRRGLSFEEFVYESLSQAGPHMPSPLRALGISFHMLEITEIGIHHYRSNA